MRLVEDIVDDNVSFFRAEYAKDDCRYFPADVILEMETDPAIVYKNRTFHIRPSISIGSKMGLEYDKSEGIGVESDMNISFGTIRQNSRRGCYVLEPSLELIPDVLNIRKNGQESPLVNAVRLENMDKIVIKQDGHEALEFSFVYLGTAPKKSMKDIVGEILFPDYYKTQ
jgi:hypothetical protein